MPRLGLGTGLLRNAPGRLRWNWRCRWATAISIPRRCIPTRLRSARQSPRPACRVATSTSPPRCFPEHMQPDDLRRSMERSLGALKTDYVDLYLIHWPMPGMDLAATLAEMMRLQRARARARHRCLQFHRGAVAPGGGGDRRADCLQPGRVSCIAGSVGGAALRARQGHRGDRLCAACARGHSLRLPEMQRIARKHDASPAQIGLKWLLDQELVAAIPRAGRRESQQENLDALRLALDDEDRAVIRAAAEGPARGQCRFRAGVGPARKLRDT